MSGPNGERSVSGRTRFAVCAVLFVLAVLPRLYHLESRYMNFADHNTANFSIYARNLAEHGWLDARFGMISNAWPAGRGEFIYFSHHPPTVALMASLVFLVLGAGEAAARLLPLLASSATCPLVYLLGRRVVTEGWAVVAALLYAAAPGAIYYGQMLNPETFVVFLGALGLWAWCRHAETGKPGWWRACLAILAAAALTDWPGTYLAPALAAASMVSPATRPRWIRMTLQAAGTAIGCAAIVFAQILWVKGSFEDIRTALSFRVLSSSGWSYTWATYLDRVWYNLGAALTTPMRSLAVVGALAAIAMGLAGALHRRVPRATPPDRSTAVGAAAGCGLLVFGSLHHVLFTNAVYYNQNIVAYLIPPAILAAAAFPAAISDLLRRWIPAPAAATIALACALPALVGFVLRAPGQVSFLFNAKVAPGWSLLGQALARAVPADRQILSTGTLAYPHLRHYLWRHVWHDRREPPQFLVSGEPGVLLRDVNTRLSDASEELLSRAPGSPALIFDVHDLRPGAAPPQVEGLAPPAVEMTLGQETFGDALALDFYGFEPRRLDAGDPGRLRSFLGVPWTPESAAGRCVRAVFVWTRLDAPARTLVPEYGLVRHEGGVMQRASSVWPMEPRDEDLAGLRPGESARREVIFFFGEWLDPGEYVLLVAVKDAGRLLPVSAPGRDARSAPQAALGKVELRIREGAAER